MFLAQVLQIWRAMVVMAVCCGSRQPWLTLLHRSIFKIVHPLLGLVSHVPYKQVAAYKHVASCMSITCLLCNVSPRRESYTSCEASLKSSVAILTPKKRLNYSLYDLRDFNVQSHGLSSLHVCLTIQRQFHCI
jgi:hypothetical protein